MDTARDHTRTKASKALRDACADALGPEMALRFAGTFLDELTFGKSIELSLILFIAFVNVIAEKVMLGGFKPKRNRRV
ncbi:hypothetical protein SAMN05414139_10533 [Burkholderia sp. D7]|nr:hypothetical protein SAMN05414139_10533 [Burkholderia sp. D7]